MIRAAWHGNRLNEEALCMSLLQYRNTPSRNVDYLLHKSCMASQYQTPCWPIVTHLYLSGNVSLQK